MKYTVVNILNLILKWQIMKATGLIYLLAGFERRGKTGEVSRIASDYSDYSCVKRPSLQIKTKRVLEHLNNVNKMEASVAQASGLCSRPRQVIWSLVSLAGNPAADPADVVDKPHVLLLKMSLQDNSEAFVELFEGIAEARLWAISQWVVCLLSPL